MNKFSTRHPKSRSGLLAALLASSCAIAPVVSSANETSQQETGSSFVVFYQDLDIAGSHGADALYDRIRSAARKVCRRSPHERSLDAWNQHRQCYSIAVERALEDVGHPALLRQQGDEELEGLATATLPIQRGS